MLSREQDRPAMQLYQPGARNRKHVASGSKGFDFSQLSPEPSTEPCYELTIGTGSEKSGDEWQEKARFSSRREPEE